MLTGDNLLEMVKAFASSPLLSDPGEERLGRMVFYDVIGYFMVLYPARIGYILNNAILVIVILGIAKKVMGKNDRGNEILVACRAHTKNLSCDYRHYSILILRFMDTMTCHNFYKNVPLLLRASVLTVDILQAKR